MSVSRLLELSKTLSKIPEFNEWLELHNLHTSTHQHECYEMGYNDGYAARQRRTLETKEQSVEN